MGNKLGPPIRCIVLSKFDVTLGPKVVVQAPEGVLSKAQFDPIKKYVEKHTSISKNKTFLFHSYGAATLRQKTDCRNTLKHALRGCSGFNSTSFRFFSPLQQLPITYHFIYLFFARAISFNPEGILFRSQSCATGLSPSTRPSTTL